MGAKRSSRIAQRAIVTGIVALFATPALAGASPPEFPPTFFGTGTQAQRPQAEYNRMKLGGIQRQPDRHSLERGRAQPRHIRLLRCRPLRGADSEGRTGGVSGRRRHAQLLQRRHPRSALDRRNPAGLRGNAEGGGAPLRARRQLLGRARSRVARSGPNPSDPHLADLERGELSSLHPADLAGALRAIGRGLPRCDPLGRSRSPDRPLRAFRPPQSPPRGWKQPTSSIRCMRCRASPALSTAWRCTPTRPTRSS